MPRPDPTEREREILSEAARILARRRKPITTEKAREMAYRSHAARRANQEKNSGTD